MSSDSENNVNDDSEVEIIEYIDDNEPPFEEKDNEHPFGEKDEEKDNEHPFEEKNEEKEDDEEEETIEVKIIKKPTRKPRKSSSTMLPKNDRLYTYQQYQTIRNLGKDQLQKHFPSDLTSTIEQYVYDYALKMVKNNDLKRIYAITLYETMCKLKGHPTSKYKKILKTPLLFDGKDFEEARHYRDMEEMFIEKPPEVSEGISECWKCKSKRVFQYSYQGRSADEGMTTVCQCVMCGNRWKI